MKDLVQDIKLPASKSISNRILIIKALSEYYNISNKFEIENLAKCDDTDKMLLVLNLFFSHFNKEVNNNNLSMNSYYREFIDETQNYNINHSGTAMRFLTAFFSIVKGKFTLTGSERMQHRPIHILVDALNTLGGNIKYKKDEGYPPLLIKGCHLLGGEIDIESSVSSQYISALMMIAPYMQRGLTINLVGEVVSSSYIFMTSQIMKQLDAKLCLYLDDEVDKEGLDNIHKYNSCSTCSMNSDSSDAVDKEGLDNIHKFSTCMDNSEKKLRRIKIYPISYLNSLNRISTSTSGRTELEEQIKSDDDKIYINTIKTQTKKVVLKIESDWSAASYFYEYLLIKGHGRLKLKNLYKNSMQGDSKQVAYWEKLGITTKFIEDAIIIETNLKSQNLLKLGFKSLLKLDFTEMPDIALSFIVACCLSGIKFTFTGLQTLKIKECDRIDAIITEMKKLGYVLINNDLGVLSWIEDKENDIHTAGNEIDKRDNINSIDDNVDIRTNIESNKIDVTRVNPINIRTYNDHRMAMALAPARIKYPKLIIENSEVVEKSFPDYWKQTVNLF